MSSHREAPEISKDPVADGTDTYAFVSPNRPEYVTLIANFIPLQKPDGGPNFYEFGDDVLYEIHVEQPREPTRDVIVPVQLHHEIRNHKTFLYNTGPISSIDDPNWNRPQFYTLTRIDRKREGRKEAITRHGPRGAAGQRRCAQHSQLRASSPRRPSTVGQAGHGCSAGNGPTRSTSTSAASSTSGRCVRSTTRTCSRWRR